MPAADSPLWQYLLLVQVLLPCLGFAVAATLCSSEQQIRRLGQVVSTLLVATGLLLLVRMTSGMTVVEVNWTLPLVAGKPSLFDRVTWSVGGLNGFLVALLPGAYFTTTLFPPDGPQRTALRNLGLLATMNLAFLGWDLGSLFTGGSLTLLTLAVALARSGGAEKRSWASMFLTSQVTGWLLVLGGLATLIGILAVIRQAPQGPPGTSTASLAELGRELKSSTFQNPAARHLLSQYAGLPRFLLGAGALLAVGLFPLHSWIFRSFSSASLSERIWLIVWVKGSFLVLARLFSTLLPDALPSLMPIGLTLAMFGSFYAGLMILSQGEFPGLHASILLWTSQIVVPLAIFLPAEMQGLVGCIVGCQLAALMLFVVATSILQDRYQTPELMAFQGVSSRAGWLGPALLVATAFLTLTPSAAGLYLAWHTTGVLRVANLAAVGPIGFLVGNLIALAGLLRVSTRLLAGPLRLPEMSPGLLERSQLPTESRSLELTGLQQTMLFLWGLWAFFIALSFPGWLGLTLTTAIQNPPPT
ncbi:hypothetical protein [Planctomicrobium sp. SH664]|uniref:hypothetical protein n=1 Tax=Planctomicrobium sp. SH664 TaxID=3448125 RepID=UPI003F5BE091